MYKYFLLVAAVVALSAPRAVANMQATQEQMDSWTAFNGAHGNQWRITWDSLGMPREIIGGEDSPPGTSAIVIARNFLAQLSDVFVLTDPNNQLEVARTDTSRIEDRYVIHVQFREKLNSFPLLNCVVKVHVAQGSVIHHANAVACRLDNPVDYSSLLLDRGAAISLALNSIPEGTPETEYITVDSGYIQEETINRLVWRVGIPTHDPGHSWQILVSQTGAILEVYDVAFSDVGRANVFIYNPGDGSAIDTILQRLDGTHNLRGTYADVTNLQYGRAYEADNDFRYNTWEPHFDDANAYYDIDWAYNKFCQLGFEFNVVINCSVREYDCDPRYDPTAHRIILGKEIYGCRNQAWDADVIYHETTHHVSCSKVAWDMPLNGQHGAVCESISDFFACSFTNDPNHGDWVYSLIPELPRYLENSYHYPEDYREADYHYSSQLLSGTLWEIRKALAPTWGYAVTDRLVLNTLGWCLPNETFTNFWEHMVYEDNQNRYSRDLERIQWEFQQRGFTPPANTAPHIDSVFFVYTPPIPPPDTIFEGRSYTVRAVAHQNGSPDGAWLKYDWMGDGNFSGSGYPYPPDTLISYRAPVHQPWETPPVLRTITVMVYDGLGGVAERNFSFLVYQPCNCGRTTTTRMWCDVSNDNMITPPDVVRMVNYVYKGQTTAIIAPPGTSYPNAPLPPVPPFTCQYKLGDANRDGTVNPADVVRYKNYVYKGQTTALLENPCGP